MSGGFAGVYQVDIQKVWGTEFWTNVYHVTAADLATAAAHGLELANIEAATMGPDITINSIRTRPYGVLNAAPRIQTVSIPGTGPTTAPTPLEVCARVTFGNGSARPSQKYLRGVLSAGGFADRKTIAPSRITSFNTSYTTPMTGRAYLVDIHGNPFTSVTLQPVVANHQLRRGSKRKAVPVI